MVVTAAIVVAVVPWVVAGAGFVVVGLAGGEVERRPVVVVVPRRDVVGVTDVVVDPGTVVAGAVTDVDGLEDVAESALMRMARPLLTPWGSPAIARPRPAQTTRSAAVPAPFAAAPR